MTARFVRALWPMMDVLISREMGSHLAERLDSFHSVRTIRSASSNL